MKIRFLYFKDCPHTKPTLNLLKKILKEKEIEEKIKIIEIESEEEARKYRFLGSPTIQINGWDIEKGRGKNLHVFGCRVYKTEDGYSGVPPTEMIIKAIEETQKKQKFLFLCTHNSTRSQMAEGLFKSLYGDRYEVYSAGTKPLRVNPYAIKVMAEIGINISSHYSKSFEEFYGMEFDYVITVCDNVKETCPFFPNGKRYLHKGFKDPSKTQGKEEEVIREFRKVRDEIKKWMEEMFGEGVIKS